MVVGPRRESQLCFDSDGGTGLEGFTVRAWLRHGEEGHDGTQRKGPPLPVGLSLGGAEIGLRYCE